MPWWRGGALILHSCFSSVPFKCYQKQSFFQLLWLRYQLVDPKYLTCGCGTCLTPQDILGFLRPSLSAGCGCLQGPWAWGGRVRIQNLRLPACYETAATHQLCTWKRSLVHPLLRNVKEQPESLRVKSPLKDVPWSLVFRKGIRYMLHSHNIIKQIVLFHTYSHGDTEVRYVGKAGESGRIGQALISPWKLDFACTATPGQQN